ncbi:DDE-domain-containing protein, partial [Athelia psychrophila]
VYGMDESGFPPSNQGTSRVIGRRGTKTQHKQGSANRENVTAIVTICADGTTLAPTIIFKGHNFMTKWADDNVSHASISHSENGWTDGEIAAEWIEKDFDRQTKEKAGGETRVLLMDGHSSHYTPELLTFAKANNIVILGYPPHCTHALQGLDVVCFAAMKQAWKDEIDKFEAEHKCQIGKEHFAGVFGRAFLTAFTEATVLAAFEKTGIHPFNPNIITAQQMKTSLPSSIVGALPLPMPSPV